MSKVYTEIVYQMTPNGGLVLVSEKSYEYSGEIALCVRQLTNEAENAEGTAATTAGNLGTQAAGEAGQLNPFAYREMHAEHEFDPNQLNEMMTAAGAGAGAATGAEQGDLTRQAASTGNASAASKGLDDAAMARMKAAAGSSEGVAAQDVMGAKQLNQQGAGLEAGLYGENLKGQLDAMGQQASDINAATNATNSGWLQQGEGIVNTGANVAKVIPGL
jgi:hypothetical protein